LPDIKLTNMNQPKYQIGDNHEQEFEDWEDDNECPDCQQADMEYRVDGFDGHYYLLCPNIDCRAKIWIQVDPDE
jgi:hypothetical protein